MKRKDNDNWKQLNDLTKYVTGKVAPAKLKKSLFVIITGLIMTIALAVSTFFVVFGMQSAFNLDNFKENIPEESIVVDMNEVPIFSSDKSLRLTYFEESAKKQVFALLIKEPWWDSFFSTDINNYDFSYYNANSNQQLDKRLIQNDGITRFDLKVKFNSSFIEFKVPVITLIKNTNKFYEKFMMFNHFDGRFSSHISGVTPDSSGTIFSPEQWTNGYLPKTLLYDSNSEADNTTIYQMIEDKIKNFVADYQAEFASNTRLFPIISIQPLPDIDINDENTFIPYLTLVENPDQWYVGNAPKGNKKEYLNLESYLGAHPLEHFYITYVSNPNIVDDLIDLQPTTVDEVITYLKGNAIDFVPFSMIQMAENDQDVVEKYPPNHKWLTNSNVINNKYEELTKYFSFANLISSSSIETINSNDYANVSDLEKVLTKKYWDKIYNAAKGLSNFFTLQYPNKNQPADNWKNIMATVDSFQKYFALALDVPITELTSFTFLDEENNELVLAPTDPINTISIKKIRFHIGTDLVTNKSFLYPHSFNFTFKAKWI